MRRAAVTLALGVAVALAFQMPAAPAKQHAVHDDEETESNSDDSAALSASCDFRESRTIGNQDPNRTLQERCENRASEMCIFGFGSRGFKPRQIHIDAAVHSACQGVTTPRALECVTNLRKALMMESGGKSMITGGKRKNRIIHLPALAVSDIRRCASE
jgi:hypothetical protein